MDSITLKAYAKINLSLLVEGRREDGYHNIRSFMQGVDLYDVVRMSKCPRNGTKYNLPHCTIDGVVVYLCTDAKTIPTDMSNLALKGVKAVLDACLEDKTGRRSEAMQGIADGLIIEIDKKLPVAAGIAGGSGNAAVCMLGLNQLMGCPFRLRELMDIGAGFGADVPFSLLMNARRGAAELEGLEGLEEASAAAWIAGIGEIVDPADPMPFHIIMANPGVSVSTPAAYKALDSLVSKHTAEELLRPLFVNDFEQYTLAAYDEAGRLSRMMRDELRAEHVLMSGSGPTMVAYYSDPDMAAEDFDRLRDICIGEAGWRVWLTSTGTN